MDRMCTLHGGLMPNSSHTEPLDQVRLIAESLDCLLDEDLQLLADVKDTTTKAWRKRGIGPSYILIGNRPLYPRKDFARFLETRKRERNAKPVAFL
jgi:hypothetical protein